MCSLSDLLSECREYVSPRLTSDADADDQPSTWTDVPVCVLLIVASDLGAEAKVTPPIDTLQPCWLNNWARAALIPVFLSAPVGADLSLKLVLPDEADCDPFPLPPPNGKDWAIRSCLARFSNNCVVLLFIGILRTRPSSAISTGLWVPFAKDFSLDSWFWEPPGKFWLLVDCGLLDTFLSSLLNGLFFSCEGMSKPGMTRSDAMPSKPTLLLLGKDKPSFELLPNFIFWLSLSLVGNILLAELPEFPLLSTGNESLRLIFCCDESVRLVCLLRVLKLWWESCLEASLMLFFLFLLHSSWQSWSFGKL